MEPEAYLYEDQTNTMTGFSVFEKPVKSPSFTPTEEEGMMSSPTLVGGRHRSASCPPGRIPYLQTVDRFSVHCATEGCSNEIGTPAIRERSTSLELNSNSHESSSNERSPISTLQHVAIKDGIVPTTMTASMPSMDRSPTMKRTDIPPLIDGKNREEQIVLRLVSEIDTGPTQKIASSRPEFLGRHLCSKLTLTLGCHIFQVSWFSSDQRKINNIVQLVLGCIDKEILVKILLTQLIILWTISNGTNCSPFLVSLTRSPQ